MINRRLDLILLTPLLLSVALLLQGCSSIPTSKPVAPTVDIESVEIVKIGLRKQELAFKLNISNPNSYDLPVQTLNFLASIDNTEVAQGFSNERVTIPGNGEAILEVLVSTRINKLLGRLLQLRDNSSDDVAYDVKGFVKLANWPARIPFNVDGILDNPESQ